MLELKQSATDNAIPFLMVSSTEHIARLSRAYGLRGNAVWPLSGQVLHVLIPNLTPS